MVAIICTDVDGFQKLNDLTELAYNFTFEAWIEPYHTQPITTETNVVFQIGDAHLREGTHRGVPWRLHACV